MKDDEFTIISEDDTPLPGCKGILVVKISGEGEKSSIMEKVLSICLEEIGPLRPSERLPDQEVLIKVLKELWTAAGILSHYVDDVDAYETAVDESFSEAGKILQNIDEKYSGIGDKEAGE